MPKLILCIAIIGVLSSFGCGGPEQAAVDQFFRAAQTNDHATLAAMSAVAPPGEVESWEAVEVVSRSTEDFVYPSLREKYEASEKRRDEAGEERKKYFEDNRDAVERIILRQRENPDYEFSGELGEIQAKWAELQEERVEIESEYQELKRSTEREGRIAGRSVVRKIDIGTFEGDVSVTQVRYNLKTPDREPLPFDVTLRRYNVSDPETERLEQSRWVIVSIEGATPEAVAAAEAARQGDERVADAGAAEGSGEAEPEPAPAAAGEPVHRAQELRGDARVQILTPETKVVGDDAVTMVHARNPSQDWLTRFTVTEYWYDEQGNNVGSSSRVHEGRFMPGEVIEIELRTRKQPNFFQNQFEFSHANGDIRATVVNSFPKEATE